MEILPSQCTRTDCDVLDALEEDAQRAASALHVRTAWIELRQLCQALGLPHGAASAEELLACMARQPVDAVALRREARRVSPRRRLLPLHTLAATCPHTR